VGILIGAFYARLRGKAELRVLDWLLNADKSAGTGADAKKTRKPGLRKNE
jgi:hypothetical protein